MTNLYYAGIGSRETPQDILERFSRTAQILESLGYTLRSGGAIGADRAFESGVKNLKQIFQPQNVPQWAYTEVQKHLPEGRFWSNYKKEITKALIARDMQQILGPNGNNPVEFVVCWTKDGKDTGGTGYAIRCAIAHNIKVYNVKNEKDRTEFGNLLREKLKGSQQ